MLPAFFAVRGFWSRFNWEMKRFCRDACVLYKGLREEMKNTLWKGSLRLLTEKLRTGRWRRTETCTGTKDSETGEYTTADGGVVSFGSLPSGKYLRTETKAGCNLPYSLGGIARIMASALMYGFRMRRRERRLN